MSRKLKNRWPNQASRKGWMVLNIMDCFYILTDIIDALCHGKEAVHLVYSVRLSLERTWLFLE